LFSPEQITPLDSGLLALWSLTLQRTEVGEQRFLTSYSDYLCFKTDVDTPRAPVHVAIILACLHNNLVVKLPPQASPHDSSALC
jgi:hypothetical protein